MADQRPVSGAPDDAARDLLVRRVITELRPRIELLCAHRLFDRSQAEDAVQETVLRVLRKLDSRDEGHSFDGFVLAIATRVCHEFNRRGTRARASDVDAADESGADVERPERAGEGASDAMVVLRGSRRYVPIDELVPFLRRCVAELDEEQRRLYSLCWGPDSDARAAADVAAQLGATAGAFLSRKSRLKQKLEACARAAFAAARGDRDPGE